MRILDILMSRVKREKSVSESLHFLPSYVMFYPDPPREGNLGLVSGVFFVYSACNHIRITMRKIRIQFFRCYIKFKLAGSQGEVNLLFHYLRNTVKCTYENYKAEVETRRRVRPSRRLHAGVAHQA